MLTFAESRQRTLSSPSEIAEYLSDTFRQMQEKSEFKVGDQVDIVSRMGISPEVGIGDVGVVMCDLPDQLHTWVLVFTSGGRQLATLIESKNLVRREVKKEHDGD